MKFKLGLKIINGIRGDGLCGSNENCYDFLFCMLKWVKNEKNNNSWDN